MQGQAEEGALEGTRGAKQSSEAGPAAWLPGWRAQLQRGTRGSRGRHANAALGRCLGASLIAPSSPIRRLTAARWGV